MAPETLLHLDFMMQELAEDDVNNEISFSPNKSPDIVSNPFAPIDRDDSYNSGFRIS